MSRRRRIAASFGRAAAGYDVYSAAQRHSAARLAELIAAQPLPSNPRVLEIGCGTGHLTQLLADRIAAAEFLASDIAPAMVAACRDRLPVRPDLHFLAMDAERPAVAGGFDLVCGNLAAQWFADLPVAIRTLTALLAPGGVLALSLLGAQSFREWREAHAALGLTAGTPAFPDAAAVREAFTGQVGITEEHLVERPGSALDFLRQLRAIGADTPAAGHRPLAAGELRRVMRGFGEAPAATYHLLYVICRVSAAATAD